MSATRLVLVLSALCGASGVGLLAAGAHVAGAGATLAGQMLLFHAPAAIAATLARKAGFLNVPAARVGTALLLAGSGLFALALASPAFEGPRLPMAAPVGGTAAMSGWIALALAALLPAPRQG